MEDCLFCKIAKGEISSTKVYEDDAIFAFKDIDPQAPYHAIFIPKKHIKSVAEVNTENSEVTAKLLEAIAKVAKAEKFDTGFRVVSNCGEDAGQSVPHLHFHLMAGRKFTWPAG